MAFEAHADTAPTVANPASRTALTVGGARRAWANKFRAGGIDSPELDARVLVGYALGLDHAALVAAEARRLAVDEENAVAALAKRRLAREPVSRILGRKEFWSLQLHIDATTLVPRPETETVVEAALAAIDARGTRVRSLRIADLGTGSGAILLALLSELPNAFGVGSDESAGALSVARDNGHRLGLARAHRGLRHVRGFERIVRRHRLQSAIHRDQRHRRAPSRSARF
jgi:release factor glutamine methyltransferase